MSTQERAVLLGGGHAHIAALRHLARHPCPALDLTLVTKSARSLYSGMLPGVVRGDYRTAAAMVDCAALARRAGAALLLGEAVAIDPAGRSITLADGRRIGSGLLSLDLGGRSAPPGDAIPVRPIEALLPRLDALGRGSGTVAVVGGGPAGVELVLALAWRWPGRPLALVMRSPEPLPGAPAPVRRRALAALARAGVAVRSGCEALDFARGRIALADGGAIPADAALWATGAVGPALLRGSGLALDRLGCARTGAALRSISHPWVLAAGDCAASDAHPRPKGGVWAVRAGLPLAAALCALAEGREPAPFRPQRRILTILGLGGGHALAWRGGLWWAGRSAWWLKDRIDRQWMAENRVD